MARQFSEVGVLVGGENSQISFQASEKDTITNIREWMAKSYVQLIVFGEEYIEVFAFMLTTCCETDREKSLQ